MPHILSTSGLHFRLVQSITATLLLAANTAEWEMLAVWDCIEEADTIKRVNGYQKNLVFPKYLVLDVLTDVDSKGFITIPKILVLIQSEYLKAALVLTNLTVPSCNAGHLFCQFSPASEEAILEWMHFMSFTDFFLWVMARESRFLILGQLSHFQAGNISFVD